MWFCLSFLVSQSFLTLKVHVFYKTLENFGYYLLKCVFCQLLFSHSGTIITGMLDVLLLFHTFLSFHSLFFKYFSDYFFRLDYLFISKFTDSSLSFYPFSKLLTLDIIFFSSKISNFFFYSFYLCWKSLSINFKAIYFTSWT